ncbi:HIT family protein [Clostridium manihotivorum]|uniref:HIT family protein n=1 Tax=Clostridium manihotivorum TaxID=2320868 RepID=A0A3R5QSY4_9CLOT|nr:HIT family protein [Clostridium manihotivorum]QAA31811.1 HIT family protein [Clostridium manihotivorum]
MEKVSCFYCEKDQRLDDLMIKVTKLSVSTLYLFKEQTYKGRCVVAYDNHINELFELSDEERTSFMKDVATAAKAIKEAFGADKMNLGAYSDKLPHLHFHIVPKYKDGYSWGGTFEMNPSANLKLSDAEYEEIITSIKQKL